ncbi:MAG: DNA (cytosine-5-)-methyltransferase [Acidobacteriota bacterium]
MSLFSGPGGLDLGFHKAGFETVFAADFSERAVETYNDNLPPVSRQLDLASTSPEEIVRLLRAGGTAPRGVIGGPPCQSFSQANVRQRRDDPRRRLIFRFAEIVQGVDAAFGLDFFLMENVSALAQPKHRKLLDKLKRSFEKSGFIVYEAVKNARDFGVAQRRPRLFLVGIKRDLARFAAFEFPDGEPGSKTVRSEIQHLPDPVFFDRANTGKRVPFHPNHWTMKPRSEKFLAAANGTGRSFKKLDWDSESPAVAYGHREIHVHPTGTRRLSILEAMLLQGFPQKFKLRGNLSEQVTQVSNAVPPPLAQAMAAAIRESLYDRRQFAQTALLEFLKARGRQFPWRTTANTFHLLVAEKLLQQTAARAGVVEAYREITSRWPTPHDLAHAPAREVRGIVQPLGLPYRADELIKLAAVIQRKHRGDVPLNRSELLALPGVGEYVADAVLSFSEKEAAAVVDTNVSRLLHRLLALPDTPPSNPSRSRRLKNLATWLADGQTSREMNYAVLDFTASICGARAPECVTCPLRLHCAGSNKGGTMPALVTFKPKQVERPLRIVARIRRLTNSRSARVHW